MSTYTKTKANTTYRLSFHANEMLFYRQVENIAENSISQKEVIRITKGKLYCLRTRKQQGYIPYIRFISRLEKIFNININDNFENDTFEVTPNVCEYAINH